MNIYNNCSYYTLNDYSVTQLILDNTSFRPLSLAVSPAEHLKKNSSALIIGLDNNHALWLVPLPKEKDHSITTADAQCSFFFSP